MKNLQKHINEVESKHNVKVIYLTKFGSQLHGTETPNSDTDYFGLFVPCIRDVLLKQDLQHFKRETSKEHNTKDDVDFELHSIYKFFHNVSKGETGALDLLFSMFREDTQVLKTDEVELIKDNYKNLLSKNVKKFVGYCIAQAKKYGIKGSRFNELEDFSSKIENLPSGKVKDYFLTIYEIIEGMKYKYISIVKKDEPNGVNTYINILGKLYQDTLQTEDFIKKVKSNLSQYGNRTKTSKDGADWKSIAHAVRVIQEAEDLLKLGYIEFPRPKAEYYRNIKLGNEDLEDVLQDIDMCIDVVNNLFEVSSLPDKPDTEAVNELLLRVFNDTNTKYLN